MGVGTCRPAIMYIILTLMAVAGALAQECPFTKSSCPVELENTLDVFYYDITDKTSCQHQCKSLRSCNYFTMLPTPDNQRTKCFLFEGCSGFEPCKNCVSGAEEPPFYDCDKGTYARETRRSQERLPWELYLHDRCIEHH